MFSWACSGTFKCCTGIALGQAQRTPRGNNSSGSIYWGKYLHCEGGGAPTPLEWISVSLFGPMFECLCIHLRLQQFIYCYNTYDELQPNRLNETLQLKCSPDGPFIRMSRASSDHLHGCLYLETLRSSSSWYLWRPWMSSVNSGNHWRSDPVQVQSTMAFSAF